MSFADGLAAFGAGYTGYSEVRDRNANARFAEEKRRRELEREDMELAARRREDEFRNEIAAALPEYSPGGAKATKAGLDLVQPSTAVDDEGNPMPAPPKEQQSEKPDSFNMLGALQLMQAAAMKKGLPEKALAYEKAINLYQKEGLEDMAGAILSGAPEDKIRDVFNAKGTVRLRTVKRIPGSTAIMAVTENGEATQFDAKDILKATMNADQLFRHEDRADVVQARREAAQLVADTRRQADETRRAGMEAADRARAENLDLRGRLVEAQIRNLDARTGRAERDPAAKPPDKAKWGVGLNRYAREAATVKDTYGKATVDPELAEAIKKVATVLAEENPAYFADPMTTAQDAAGKIQDMKLEAARRAKAAADSIEKDPITGGLFMSGVNGQKIDKATWIAEREKENFKRMMADIDRSTGPGKVYSPRSKADMAMVPSGAIYINPADGKRYRKE